MSGPSAGTGQGLGPSVSVVMPTRDRADLVSRAIDSVIRQTFADWELVVVDDGSRDRTAHVLADYAVADPRIRSCLTEQTEGPAAARNLGVRQARGRYVAFLDDDCEWLPEKLERQIALLERAGEETGVAYCPLVYIREDGRWRVIGSELPTYPGARRALLRGNSIDTSCGVVRREALDQVGGFDERLPRLADWDLWMRLAATTRFGFIPDLLVRGYYTPGSISTRSDALISACRQLLAKFEREVPLSRAELADCCYALGHMLMIHGAPPDGRKALWQSIRYRPWPPRRWVMAVLSTIGCHPYGLAARLHRMVAERWRRAPVPSG